MGEIRFILRQSDQARAIAAISDQLQLPVGQVDRVFQKEFERLKAQARITTFPYRADHAQRALDPSGEPASAALSCPYIPASASCHPDPRARAIRVLCTGLDALCAPSKEVEIT